MLTSTSLWLLCAVYNGARVDGVLRLAAVRRPARAGPKARAELEELADVALSKRVKMPVITQWCATQRLCRDSLRGVVVFFMKARG